MSPQAFSWMFNFNVKSSSDLIEQILSDCFSYISLTAEKQASIEGQLKGMGHQATFIGMSGNLTIYCKSA